MLSEPGGVPEGGGSRCFTSPWTPTAGVLSEKFSNLQFMSVRYQARAQWKS